MSCDKAIKVYNGWMARMSKMPGNDIHITGIAGFFPECESVKELGDNLYNKVDLMTDDERRWRHINPEIPRSSGKLRNISRFDASFFGIDYKKAHCLDHMGRLLLERVYECIIDAGVNPSELFNSKTAVVIGMCTGESECDWLYKKFHKNQHGIKGCVRSSTPNNISQWLGLTGPTFIVDTACSSSMFALEQAFKLIRDGQCEAAIVCGSNLNINPLSSLCFARLGVLSKDGRCKCFDEKANGYGRSESVVACFLQKAKDSRRVHAKLVHAKTNCDGYKEKGITYPAGNMQAKLLSEFYEECGIQPSTLEFVEAHGTGTRVGDPEELSAIDQIFCSGRKDSLLIGSIKSNLGHTEPSSGLNSVAKLCLAYNTGYIPPNINFSTHRQDISALVEGRLKVVTEKTPWNRGLAGISSFGFGGANAHVLLENVARDKINNGLPKDELPRLVCTSGRTISAVAKILDDLESRPVDVDEIRLWHAIHEQDIKRHNFRGFTLLQSTATGTVSLARDIKRFTQTNNRPLCFQYSNLDLHWSSVAFALMKIPTFAETLQQCQILLEKVNFNLFSLLNCESENKRKNIFSLVGSTVVQIGITNILSKVGIKPNYSTSKGNELLSAYADEKISTEEVILATYRICTKSYDGENETKLNASQDTKKNVECNNLQFLHSKISNLYSKDGAPSSIPSDAIVIDVGIDENSGCSIKSEGITYISLLKPDMKDCRQLLTALGSLFEIGLNPKLANIYPTIELPVPQSTPLLSHLVEWNHQEKWNVVKYSSEKMIECNERKLKISLIQEHSEYITGHNIDGRVIYPATGYLVLVWETLALLTDRLYFEVSVEFRDVYFQRATNMPKDGPVEFTISLHRGSGCFEVSENEVPIVKGVVQEKPNIQNEYKTIPEYLTSDLEPEWKVLKSKDFYKELNLRGYQYKNKFRGVLGCTVDGTRGSLIWDNNWVTFLDTMLQVNIVACDTRSLYVPTRIDKLCIDVDLHNKVVSKMGQHLQDSVTKLPFRAYPNVKTTRAGGAEIRGVHITAISKKLPLGIPIYEQNLFVPHYNNEEMKLNDALRVNLQIILENIQTYKFKSIEVVDEEYKINNLQPIIEEVAEVLADMPLIQADLTVLAENNFKLDSSITVSNKKITSESNNVLFIGANLLERQDVLEDALKTLKKKCFILSRETKSINYKEISEKFEVITIQKIDAECLIMLRLRINSSITSCVEIRLADYEFSWIETVKECMNKGNKVLLYNQNEPVNGILGLVNCLRKEAGGENVYALLIDDMNAPKFDLSLEFYKDQLDQELAINVLKNGQWGTYRHLLFEKQETSPSHHAYLKPTVIGDLSSLRWLEGPLSPTPSSLPSNSLIKVFVYCSALNFRDAMTSMGRVTVEAVARGRLDQECVQGLEASGVTMNGSRVMLMGRRCISNLVECDESMTWPVPDEWSLVEAATVPVAYATVYMALVMVGKMRKDEKILIHAGSGAVGQAAINVALHHGLKVFTTVGTPAKRAFIKRLFPQIQDSHIGNSRDLTFEDMIRRETNGEGVDLVLNSLADEKLQASAKCLRQGGRFLEIGKYDVTQNTPIETCFLKRGISFHGVMLDYIHEKSSYLLRKNLKELVLHGIMSGAVRPISYCLFEKEEIENAFRYMAGGRHVGKLIIRIRDEERSHTSIKPKSFPLPAIPRYMCDPEHVYVLVGGLGGFGLELADWLVLRGARKLLFSSRRGISNGYQSLRLKTWKSYGTKIQISTHDVSTETGCESMLKMAASMGPVRAIFNLAVILRDAIFQNQTRETFQESFKPKAQTTIYLDQYSRKICPDLRDFVVFSSVSCGRGNAGQTNYGYSNSIMERVCEERKKQGLPGLAIQWGAIGDVGLVADMQDNNLQLEIGGTLQQRISSCIDAMDLFLKQNAPIVSSIVVAEKKTGGATSGNVVEVIAQIIGIGDTKTLSRQVPLSEMGMDSVMAVEIKQTLERDYEIFLSAQEIRMLTFAKLSELSKSSEDTVKEEESGKTNNVVNLGGIQLLINKIGDEKSASLPFVNLPTLVSNESKEMASVNQEIVLFLLPGLESCAETFKLLCSQLKVRACVLQLGLNQEYDDFIQITDRLYKMVKEILPTGAPYFLLGYSFGSIPMLNLAAKLEKEGSRGLLFCIDGSPEYSPAMAKTFLNSKNDQDLQIQILTHVFNIMQRDSSVTSALVSQISIIESFDEKIQCVIKSIPSHLNYSHEFLISIAKSVYKRLHLLLNYDLKDIKQINSPIVLIRQKSIPVGIKCDKTYGLDKLTSGSVAVHLLDGDHATIVDNVECAHVINEKIHEMLKQTLLSVNKVGSHNKLRQLGEN